MALTSAQGLIQRPETREWLRRAAKLGYATKGVVYGVMGALVLQTALGGGKMADQHAAVEHIGRQPFGSVGLVVVGVGLLGYALWCLVDAITNADQAGRDAKGVAVRVGTAVNGLVNGALGVAALKLASGEGRASGDKSWVASLLTDPLGQVCVVAAGLGVAGAGIYQIYSGASDKFERHLHVTRLSAERRRWVRWSGRVGYVARGVVFGIIGVALFRAGLLADQREIKGFKEALVEIASQPQGQMLLVAVALGFLAYAIHLITTVPYRKLV